MTIGLIFLLIRVSVLVQQIIYKFFLVEESRFYDISVQIMLKQCNNINVWYLFLVQPDTSSSKNTKLSETSVIQFEFSVSQVWNTLFAHSL